MAHLQAADDGGGCGRAAAAAAAVIAVIVGVSSWLCLVCVAIAAAIATAAGVAPHCEEAGEGHRAAGGPQAEVPSLARDIHANL